MSLQDLVIARPQGLYCPAGDFYIDPWLLMAYSLGKAQRLLAGVDAQIGPIVVHVAVAPLSAAERRLPRCRRGLARGPHAAGSGRQGRAGGWMALRGARRRQGLDRGFLLSDHADWLGLQRAMAATGAERVIVTNGQEAVMVRWLREQGLQADSFRTEYGGEGGMARPPRPAPALLAGPCAGCGRR